MAFENAVITKEDDEKYGLSEIYYKYNPYYETFPIAVQNRALNLTSF